MLSFYQCLDAQMEQKVLLISVSELDFPPALGELFEVNGLEFVIYQIKHKLNTTNMKQDLEYYLMKPEDLYDIEVEYIDEEENFNDRRF